MKVIAELKKRLVAEKSLASVQNYYLDHMQEVMAAGERVTDDLLEMVLRKAVGSGLGREVSLTGLILTRVAEHGFVYGGFFAEGRPGSVFYFEDLRMGLVTVVKPDGSCTMSRFRCETAMGGVSEN